MVQLYLHPIRLKGVVLNQLSSGITFPVCVTSFRPPLISTVVCQTVPALSAKARHRISEPVQDTSSLYILPRYS
jgi:hypothetical protein